jgi:endoglucanase
MRHIPTTTKILLGPILITGLVLLGIATALHRSDSEQATHRPITANPLAGAQLYVDTESDAAQQVRQWQTTQPADATAMAKLAALPTAKWLTSGDSLDSDFSDYLRAARVLDNTVNLVVYDIPDRDCGEYSKGGATNLQEYKAFIDKFTMMVGDTKAAIIVEPDAVANMAGGADSCLSAEQQSTYRQALSYATSHLQHNLPNATIYLDAGNSGWITDMQDLSNTLQQAGVNNADGVSLNVSSFQTSADSLAYGHSLSKAMGGNVHFVIDTSRNGQGPYQNPKYEDIDWCNPPGRSLGHYPTVDTGDALADGYLYIKTPGESDGMDPDYDKCYGGPVAGQWWPAYALDLIRRWPTNLQP